MNREPMTPPDPTIERLLVHGEFLRRLARRLLGDDALAEDVVQQTWLAALEKPPARPGSWRAWLTGVTRNLARQARRGEHRRARREQIASRPEAEPSSEESSARLQLERQLVDAVAQLFEPYRTTVMLRYLDDLSIDEVAQRLDVPVETVRTRLRRGIALLRERLDASRHDWRRALIPLAMPSGGPAVSTAAIATTSAGVTFGAWLMAVWKIGVAGVAVVAGLWWLVSEVGGGGALERELGTKKGVAAVPELDSPEPSIASRLALGEQQNDATETTDGRMSSSKPSPSLEKPAALGLVLELVCGDAAVPKALVWVLRDNEILARNRSDGAGRVTLRAFGGEGRLIVHGEDRAPEIVEVSLEAGERRVELTGTLAVSGHLQFSGRTLEEPILLELVSDVPWTTRYEMSGSRYASAEALTSRQPVLTQTVGADGRFEFRGLSAAWSGRLRLPNGFVFEEGRLPTDNLSRSVVLASPREGLELGVRRLARLWGRVFEADGIRPVSHGKIAGWIHHGRDDLGPMPVSVTMNIDGLGIEADDSGFFEVPLLVVSALEHFSLQLSRADGSGTSSFKIRTEDIGDDGELGEFRLAPAREIRFIVWNRRGQPVAGARALVGPQGRLGTSPPTDSLGEGVVVSSTLEDTTMRVVALGYEPVLIEVSVGRTEPIEVVLDPGASIDVRITLPEGGLATVSEMSLGLTFEPGLFTRLADDDRELETPDIGFQSVGGARWTGMSLEESLVQRMGFQITERRPTEGRCLLAGVHPGKSFTIEVRAPDGTIVGQYESEGVATGEQRVVEIPITAPRRVSRGRVRDAQGQPCRNATVSLTAAKRTIEARTDALGRFVVEPLYASTYGLTVRCDGYRELVREELLIGDEALELTLERD